MTRLFAAFKPNHTRFYSCESKGGSRRVFDFGAFDNEMAPVLGDLKNLVALGFSCLNGVLRFNNVQ